MILEKQVCSIELAKKLRGLGVEQKSIFWHWATDVEKDGLTWWTISEKEPRRGKKVRELSTPKHYRGKISAFTVAELGELLPKQYQIYSYPTLVNGKKTWDCTSQDSRIQQTEGWEHGQQGTPPMFSDTEADARAKMLVYLLESKLIAT